MWNKNKDIITKLIWLIGAGLIAWGVTKTKISQLETDVSALKLKEKDAIALEVKSAPKARQRCVADGKQVNIPVPIASAMWGRILIGYPGVGCPGLGRSRRWVGKSARHIPRLPIERACSRSN